MGGVISKHAIVCDDNEKIAMLLFSCSARLDENVDRKLIGWGNRFLHYKEFEYLKEHGYKTYDWNGVCIDETKIERYNIGLFKTAFGGDLVEIKCLFSPIYVLTRFVKRIFT